MTSPQPQGTASQAAYWEERYHSGDTPWNKGQAHPGLTDWLRETPEMAGSKVVVPGCGWGYDVAAWKNAGADSWGLDVCGLAIQGASRLHVGGQFRQGSIFDPPLEWSRSFDYVFEHTCFCAIDPIDRPLYLAGVHRLLRLGGKLLAVFYCYPDHEEGPPFGITPRELAAFFEIPGDFSRDASTGGNTSGCGRLFTLEARWNPPQTFPGRENCEEMWLLRKTH